MRNTSHPTSKCFNRSPVQHFPAFCYTISAALLLASSVAWSKPITGFAENMPAIDREGLIAAASGFEENKGQVLTNTGEAASFVRYRLSEGNADIFLLGNGIAYQFNQTHYPEGYAALRMDAGRDPAKGQELDALRKEISRETYRMDMLLEGANADALITTEGRSEEYTNYNGQDAMEVHSYSRVTYHEIYPGIDWVVYTTAKGLKYDFVLRPGADPALIQLRFKDHEELLVDADGQLIHGNRMGQFIEERPVSFQNGKEVGTRFVLDGDRLSFAVDAYDRSQPLTIDPDRIWATYYGGSELDVGASCTVDNDGNVYLAGTTNSTSAIASGGYQSTFAGGEWDAFLVKFNASGARLWATYYGGTGDELVGSCAVDGDSNVYLSGTTNSGSAMSSGGHQGAFGGIKDAFLVKFNASGVRQWATYYGGTAEDSGNACAVDGGGNVYLAGTTSSSTAIAYGGHQNVIGGGGSEDAFLVKFNTNGIRQWATYYGGMGNDWGRSCTVDGSDNVYLAGGTGSSAAIATGGHQTTNAGSADAYVVKFSSNGTRQWGTYYGGPDYDVAYSCAVDGGGNVFLAGQTDSYEGISYHGHQEDPGGWLDEMFLAKFNPSGALEWGTYYGGWGYKYVGSCAVDLIGNVYLSGATNADLGISYYGYQDVPGSDPDDFLDSDAFLAKFNTNGLLQWGTFYGGIESESSGPCAVGNGGMVYLCGSTSSIGPIASGGHQNAFGGGDADAFLVKFDGTSTCDLPVALPYFEDFESQPSPILPPCTSVQTIAGHAWISRADPGPPIPNGIDGGHAGLPGFGAATTDSWLFLPGMELIADTMYQLSYDYGMFSGSGASMKVMYGSTPQSAAMTTELANHVAITSYNTSNTMVFIPSTTGTYYFGFKGYANSSFDFLKLDNISLKRLFDPNPHDLAVTGSTATSATFSWLAGTTPVTTYQWEVRTSGQPGGGSGGLITQGTTNAVTTAAQANGLSASVSYTVHVRADFGNGAFSPWLSRNFTIPPTCSSQSALPYWESFESVVTPALPTCMNQTHTSNPNWSTQEFNSGGMHGKWAMASPRASVESYPYQYLLDWLFTPSFSLVGGTSYTLSYRYSSDGAPYTESMLVALGSEPTVVGMVPPMATSLANHSSITSASPVTNTVTFTPSISGIYYVGFAHTSALNQGHLYLDDIRLGLTECLPPSNLAVSEVTANSIGLSWNPSPSVPVLMYGMEARISGAPGSGNDGLLRESSLDGNHEQDYTIFIEAPHTYNVYLRTACGAAGMGDLTPYSDWIGPVTFTNELCPPVPVPYAENFDACTEYRLPPCMSVEHTSPVMEGRVVGWIAAGYWTGSGLSAQASTNSVDTLWLYTPGLNLTAGVNYTLKYDHIGDAPAAYGNSPNAVNMIHPLVGTTTTGTVLTTVAHFTPTSSGAYYIGFRGEGFYTSGTTLDNISVFETPAPIELMANYITLHSALLSWSLPGDQPTNGVQWEVRTGGLPGSGTNGLGASGNSPYFNADTVFSLLSGTTYSLYVRSDWGGGSFSSWAGPHVFTTLTCPGNELVLAITTDNWPQEITWEITNASDTVIATGGPTAAQANMLVSETICLGNASGNACYGFRLMDSYGDGITNGGWELRTVGDKLLLRDDFNGGFVSPSATPLNPNYTQHNFCLPAGPANIAPSECGIFDNLLGNKVYCNKVTGAANYQFEFTDPDAGFIRRIARPYNYVHFWDMVTTPLVPGVKYFARVRTDRDGAIASAHFGSGCEMGLGQVVICTQLIQAPAYGHSCNETRTFNTSANNSFIYATPVQGATEYQFRIFNTQEGYDQTFTRNTYILQLKWNNNVAPPLTDGYTYAVEMNVKVNGVYSGFCASTCNITINNSGPAQSMVQVMGTATLWPNPVRDGQVNLNMDGLVDAEQNITFDIQDVYGKQVFAQEFMNSGERFNTILNLSSDLASGVYMVNITVNGERTVQRLSIIR